MKIKCFILRKDRTVSIKNVSPDKGVFRFNDGIYVLGKEAVNLVNMKAIPELVFIEGNPNPVQLEKEIPVKDGKKKGKDEPKKSTLLDLVVMKNALKVSGRPRGLGMDIIADYLRDPLKIMVLVFALIILIAFIGGLFR